MTKTEHHPESIRAGLTRKRVAFVMAGALLGMLLGALDQTVVGTAMPRIITDLNGMQHYAWVFTAYMLSSTVTIPIYGKLSDVYGRRPFFLAGMVIFLVGSALSGVSQSMGQLIAFRALQGVGAGALMPIAIAIIGDIFPPAERGKWQGLMTSVFGLAVIVGPLLGGWLTDHWGWRWCFYVNMPVGAVALLTAGTAFPRTRRVAHKVDYLGTLVLVAGTVPMLLAFSFAGNQYKWWSVPVVGLLVVSAVVLTLFVLIERSVSEPILNPALFGNRIFSVSVVAMFLISAGMMGAILYLPLFVQGVIGTSATNSGVILMPMMLGFMSSSIIGGQILSRTGRYKVLAIVSLGVSVVGTFLLSRMSETSTNGIVIRNMIVVGIGIGVLMSLFTIVVQNAFSLRRIGEVTAGLTFMRSIGGTIGVAVLGSVMTSRFSSGLTAALPPTLKQVIPAAQLAQLKSNPEVLIQSGAAAQMKTAFGAFGARGLALFNEFMGAIRHALAHSIASLYGIALWATVIAFLASFLLKEIPLRKSHHEPIGVPLEGQTDEAALVAEAEWEVELAEAEGELESEEATSPSSTEERAEDPRV